MDNISDFNKRKKDMMELWKETFHDSDEYIELVFDTYFSLENTFVRYDENRIIAALFAIGYEFQILAKEEKQTIHGLYLCGLSTVPEWRRRGIMSDLMNEVEEAARNRGFDFTFLIPADSHLRKYYEGKGYHTASWRVEDSFVCHFTEPFQKKPSLNIYAVNDFFRLGKNDFLCDLADRCRELEISRHENTIVHSRLDLLTAMRENENSILLTHPSFDPEYPILAKVLVIAFPELSDTMEATMKLVGHYTLQDCRENDSHQSYMTNYPNEDMIDAILTFFEKKEMQIVYPSSTEYIGGRGVTPYAMIKHLKNSTDRPGNENLGFQISLMLD